MSFSYVDATAEQDVGREGVGGKARAIEYDDVVALAGQDGGGDGAGAAGADDHDIVLGHSEQPNHIHAILATRFRYEPSSN